MKPETLVMRGKEVDRLLIIEPVEEKLLSEQKRLSRQKNHLYLSANHGFNAHKNALALFPRLRFFESGAKKRNTR
jgi:hypothetical protein